MSAAKFKAVQMLLGGGGGSGSAEAEDGGREVAAQGGEAFAGTPCAAALPGRVAMLGFTTGRMGAETVSAAALKAARARYGDDGLAEPESDGQKQQEEGQETPLHDHQQEPQQAAAEAPVVAAAATGRVAMLGFTTGRMGAETVSAAALKAARALFGDVPMDSGSDGEAAESEGAGSAALLAGDTACVTGTPGEGETPRLKRTLLRMPVETPGPSGKAAAAAAAAAASGGSPALSALVEAAAAASPGWAAEAGAAAAGCVTPATVPLAGRARGAGPSRLGRSGNSGGAATTGATKRGGRRPFVTPRLAAAPPGASRFKPPRTNTPQSGRGSGGDSSGGQPQRQKVTAVQLHALSGRLAQRVVAEAAAAPEGAAAAGAALRHEQQRRGEEGGQGELAVPPCAGRRGAEGPGGTHPLPLDARFAAEYRVVDDMAAPASPADVPADAPAGAPAASGAPTDPPSASEAPADGAPAAAAPGGPQPPAAAAAAHPRTLGWADLRAALLAAGASSAYASSAWVENHYRWVVWKLARAELLSECEGQRQQSTGGGGGSSSSRGEGGGGEGATTGAGGAASGGHSLRGRLLTASVVLDELKYR